MRIDERNTKSREVEHSSEFLETLILNANDKFFEGYLHGPVRFDGADFILYNAIIKYFKGNSWFM
jgi:hypothetical protein